MTCRPSTCSATSSTPSAASASTSTTRGPTPCARRSSAGCSTCWSALRSTRRPSAPRRRAAATGRASGASSSRRSRASSARTAGATFFSSGAAYLMMVDVDRFKEVYDSFGHGGGDAALKAVADRQTRCFPRRGDLVARCGGDEFTVVLRDVRPEEARMLAERLVVAIRSSPVDHQGKGIPAWLATPLSTDESRDSRSEEGPCSPRRPSLRPRQPLLVLCAARPPASRTRTWRACTPSRRSTWASGGGFSRTRDSTSPPGPPRPRVGLVLPRRGSPSRQLTDSDPAPRSRLPPPGTRVPRTCRPHPRTRSTSPARQRTHAAAGIVASA